ncbi:MAG: aldehyde dehydrogenase family protein [Bacteroidetes bacterium]|nr:aldehyde dehydrogenase family protein [Bacteroidota bacterium]
MENTKTATKENRVSKNAISLNGNGQTTSRLAVNKTYKMYVDGKFIRSESGRYFTLPADASINICRASRKDIRDAVVVARKAQPEWGKRSAYNKGQILYRIAEMLEARKAQIISSLIAEGIKPQAAESEVHAAIDTFIHYAGWSDKYIQLFSTVNPVESSHFNFSYPEPQGITACIAPEAGGALGLAQSIAPAIVGGNTIIVLSSYTHSVTACIMAEIFHSSDVPGGVINILNGQRKELMQHFATHKDINAIVFSDVTAEEYKAIETNACSNLKRVVNLAKRNEQSPYRIMELQEIKTTWHPVGL